MNIGTRKLGALFGILGTCFLVQDVRAGTAVAPGSGHPENLGSTNPWDDANANAQRVRVFDNKVCSAGPDGTTTVWITPLAIPTSTGVSTRAITQNRTSLAAKSEAWSFNPNGSVFQGIAEASATNVGNLSVPAGGTAFVKSILKSELDGGPKGCIHTVVFN